MILKLVRFNPAAQACLVLLTLCIGALPPAAGFGAASHQDADATFGVICVDANGETVEAAEVYVFQNRGGDDRRYIQFGPFKANMGGRVVVPKALFMDHDGHFDRWIYSRVPDSLVGVARSAKWKNGTTINEAGRVILQPSTTVEGTIAVPPGFDPKEVLIRVRTLHITTGERPFDFESFPREDAFPGLATALSERFDVHPDLDGTFRFKDMPQRGRLYLVTQSNGLAEAQWWNENQALGGGVALSAKIEGVVGGRVVSPEGDPLAGQEVTARLSGKGRLNPSYLSSFKALTNDEGEFIIRGLPETEFVVSVTDPDDRWSIRPLENLLVPTGQRKRLEIRLESTILVSGRVLDPDGKPVANAAISAIANSDEGSGLADTSTDEAGRYALRLPSGVVKLYFNSLPSGFIYPNEQIIANLDLKQGQDDVQDLDFKLERDQ